MKSKEKSVASDAVDVDGPETNTKNEVKPAATEPKEELVVPIDEDCFEYKLVGVNVHSGTANAGHYWSYINTKRGLDEPDGEDPVWERTDNDPWMEFNDSMVSNI